ncbi:MAG: glycosyltransferase [Smithella sp.]|jgi:glycosyltransferase involved in cell wall biosynthesis
MNVKVYRRVYPPYKLASRFENHPAGWNVEVTLLDEIRQATLSEVLNIKELSSYDRVILDLKWGLIKRQRPFISRIPNLVIHESDAWFNFAPFSGNYRRFEYFYHRLGPFRLISTSWTASSRFREQGLDVVFVPKSFDSNYYRHLELKRDIEFGFIGTQKNRIYRKRNRMLKDFSQSIPLFITQTKTKEEYLETLNRIDFFISADVGMHEYMIKNFEALACGCILVAYRQGKEEEALGFVDMNNVVLYSTPEEALQKIHYLQQNQAEAEALRKRGMDHVNHCFTVAKRDERLFSALKEEIKTQRDLRPFSRRATDFLHA